jgi:hypothetical protein
LAGQITLAGPDPGNNVIQSDGKAATLDNSSNTISGTGQLIDTKLTLFNEGLIDADNPGGQLTLGGASIINDGGTLEATNGGILSILDNVNDSGGTIAAVGGIVRDFGTITGGTVEIGRGGTLILGSGGKTTADVQFTGPNSTLVLEASSSNVGGNVVGAGVTDDFDFQFVSFSSAVQTVWQQNGSTGTLSLVKSGSTVASLTLAGHYTSANFTPMTDGGEWHTDHSDLVGSDRRRFADGDGGWQFPRAWLFAVRDVRKWYGHLHLVEWRGLGPDRWRRLFADGRGRFLRQQQR